MHSHKRTTLFGLALIIAISGMYAYKGISFLLPIMTFAVIRLEGGIKNISLQVPLPFIFLLLLLAWIGVSIFWAENQPAALKAFISLTLTFFFSLLFLSCLMQAPPRLILKVYTLINFTGFLLIFFILSQIYIDTFLEGFINYNGNSSYMLRMKPTGSILGLTSFVGCAFLWVYKNKTFAFLMFFLLLFIISLTLCQTAICGTVLSGLIFVLSYFLPFWITRIGMIFSYTFLLLSPLLYTYILPSSTPTNYTFLQGVVNASLFHRWLGWEYYSRKFLEKPLLGWGADSSRYVTPGQDPGFNSLLHPHNNSIQAYVELGLIGGILYALFFASLFYLVEKRVKDRLSVAVCNATITFGFVSAEVTHSAWRNYWLSLVTLTTGLIILFLKAREAQLHVPADHLERLPA